MDHGGQDLRSGSRVFFFSSFLFRSPPWASIRSRPARQEWTTTTRTGIWSRTPPPGISPTHLCGERCKKANVGGNLVRTSEVRIDQQILKIDLISFRIALRPGRMPTRRVLAKTAQTGEASSMQGNRRSVSGLGDLRDRDVSCQLSMSGSHILLIS